MDSLDEGLSMALILWDSRLQCLDQEIIRAKCRNDANLQHRLHVVNPLLRIWRIQNKITRFEGKRGKNKTKEGAHARDFSDESTKTLGQFAFS